MDIFYCQRTIFPAKTAHAIHTAATAAAFSIAGVPTHYFPGYSLFDCGKSVTQFFASLGYDILPSTLHMHGIPSRHKGIYGLCFARLLRKTLTQSQERGQNSICFASSVKEAVIALNQREKTPHPERTKVVFEIHHLISKLKKGCKSKKLYALEKRAFAECDMVVFNCCELARQAEGYLPEPRRSLVSPLGLNNFLIAPLPTSAPKESGEILLAYFGSLQPGKGVENLIRAVALLPQNYRLRIIGGRPEEQLKEYFLLGKSLGLCGKGEAPESERIEFSGQVAQSAIRTLLMNVDISVIPLETENDFLAPMKMYESVGFALPIVATPQPSLRDALLPEENACFAQSTTPESLAEAIKALGENEELRAKMRSNNAQLGDGFSINKRVHKLLAEFSALF